MNFVHLLLTSCFVRFRLDEYVDQNDDLSMFALEDTDVKDIYPDVENALACFGDNTRAQEWRKAEFINR